MWISFWGAGQVTLEKYNRFVPNLTRTDGKALLEVDKIATHFAHYQYEEELLEYK